MAATALCFGAPPAFEVASVKPTAHGRTPDGWSHSSIDIPSPGRLVAANSSISECIRFAYGLKDYQLSGPEWLNSDAASFDIEAKAAPGTSRKEMREMLKTLLADRFKLTLHREPRSLPVYELSVAKNGPKLPEAIEGAKTGLTARGGRDGVRVTGESATMASLADRLSSDLDRPVFDKTGLAGSFRIALEWSRGEGDGASIFSAIQEQLGLRLEAAKAVVEVAVVDHAEKMPAGN